MSVADEGNLHDARGKGFVAHLHAHHIAGRGAPRQAREFLGLMLLDGGGVLRGHQKVAAARGEGEVTSGTFSPTLAMSIGLARLPRGTAPGDTVRVQVRDKSLAARVVKIPFVRNGQSLVNSNKEAP